MSSRKLKCNSRKCSVREKLEENFETAKRILDQTKGIELASNVAHQYDDKYSLVEFIIEIFNAALLTVLKQLLGEDFNDDILKQCIDTVQSGKQSLTLRFKVEETCAFLKSEKKNSEVQQQGQQRESTYTNKVIQVGNVNEFHWRVNTQHSLVLFVGSDASEGRLLSKSRKGATNIISKRMELPFPQSSWPYDANTSQKDINLTWLFTRIDKATLKCGFYIDRELSNTPCRNEEVKEAIKFAENLRIWANYCEDYFVRRVARDILGGANPAIDWEKKVHSSAADRWWRKGASGKLFSPILPIFINNNREVAEQEECTVNEENPTFMLEETLNYSPILLQQTDVSLLLNEHCRSINNALNEIWSSFPDPLDEKQVISGYEAKLVLLFRHSQHDLCRNLQCGIDFVEETLHRQLVRAIGHDIAPKDFEPFLRLHNQCMFSKPFAPKPFSYAIRQPNLPPDGALSIMVGFPPPPELLLSPKKRKDFQANFFRTWEGLPVETFATSCCGSRIYIPLNAAATAEFTGYQCLHGWMDTCFSQEYDIRRRMRRNHSVSKSRRQYLSAKPDYHMINACARQLCSLVLVIGTVSGPDKFLPKEAIILQNNDDILIPLILKDLPSAREFRDAVKTLSPKQADFANSFRAMQLGSSVFGICIIQIRPQMEALLGLPQNCLIKEIQMVQDLMALMVDYQIPSTLFSCNDCPDDSPPVEKVAKVKERVNKIMGIIKETKEQPFVDMVDKGDIDDDTDTVLVVKKTRCETYTVHVPRAEAAQSAFGKEESPAENSISNNIGMPKNAYQEENKQHFPSKQIDYTEIPKNLDRMFEKFDTDGALRTLMLSTGKVWVRRRQNYPLAKQPETTFLFTDRETKKALDLIDALSCSGSLQLEYGELHVVIGIRHRFEQTVMSTVIEKNVNPIAKADYSSLLIASAIHQVDVPTLLKDSVDPPFDILIKREFP